MTFDSLSLLEYVGGLPDLRSFDVHIKACDGHTLQVEFVDLEHKIAKHVALSDI